MRRRQLKALWQRLGKLQKRTLSTRQLLLQLGVADHFLNVTDTNDSAHKDLNSIHPFHGL
jgi:hypothetical protein